MRRQLLLPIALLTWASAVPAAAQVKCTMPNGVTITRQIGQCPNDAVAAYTLDGKPLPKPADTEQGRQAAQRIQDAKQARIEKQEAQSKAEAAAQIAKWNEELKVLKAQKEKDRADREEKFRMQACQFLGMPRSQCETSYSLMVGNHITISTHILPSDVNALCKANTAKLRHQFFEGRLNNGWIARIKYSPTGALVAECSL